MQEHGELPKDSLKSFVPVSLRAKGDAESSNSVAAITVDLATNVEDPAKRIQVIKNSVRAGRALFEGMSPGEIQLYTQLISAPGLLMELLGAKKVPPPNNLAISNVPGIQEQMYWNGARLDGAYPLSIVNHGMALNITLVTNNQNVDFGIIACRRTMPQVQRLIDYMEDALVELEVAAGLAVSTQKKVAVTKKSAPKKKAAASKKAAPRT